MTPTPLQQFIIAWDAWAIEAAAKRANMRIYMTRGTPESLDEFAAEFEKYAEQVAGMRERLPAAIAKLKKEMGI